MEERLLAVEWLRPQPRRPVDEVLDRARYRRVVLRRRDDERVRGAQSIAESLRAFRDAALDFAVTVVERTIKILDLAKSDRGALARHERCSVASEPIVERLA